MNSIKDIAKAIVQSVQPSTIIPSIIIVIFNILVVAPHVKPQIANKLSNEELAVWTILISISLSYTLYAFNIPLIRLIEGYIGRENLLLKKWLQSRTEKQIERYQKLVDLQAKYPIGGFKRELILQELDTHFPSRGFILPTRIGNTIAAFEEYPLTRYGINSIALWPRIVPLLCGNKYIDLVSHQKSVFDFLLNLSFVFVIGEVELFGVLLARGDIPYAFLSLLLAILLINLLYIGVISSAVQWGLAVRVAFDLYRQELSRQMHLQPVSSFKEERNLWSKLSKMISYGDKEFSAFIYQKNNQKS